MVIERRTLAARVTRLERFRKLRDERDADKYDKLRTEFITDLLTPTQASRKMQMGTAFHAILANPKTYHLPSDDGGCYMCDGFMFPSYVIHDSLNAIERTGTFEIPGYKIYDCGDCDVIVTGTCDYLSGKEIGEFKTRWFEGKEWGVWDSNFLRDNYEASYQHRFYMDIFGADRVKYTIFAMRDEYPVKLIHIKTDIICDRYDQMTNDLQSLVCDFAEFIRYNNLEDFCQPGKREQDFVNLFPF